MSNGLIAVRKALDPAFEPQNSLPNVPLNAACEPCSSDRDNVITFSKNPATMREGLETACFREHSSC